MHHYCVYCLTSPDGKKYFGVSSREAEERWKNGNGYKGNNRLNEAIMESSFAEFKKEIIASNLYRDDAEKLEAELIKEYDTRNPEKGFNIKEGGLKDEYDVYLLTFPDGMRYVGMTSRSVEERWENGNGYRNNVRLAKAIKEVGFENIKKEHFAYALNRGSAERIETGLIEHFDCANPEKGYNRAKGALNERGWHLSDETKRKLSATLTGRKLSEETRKRMSEAHEKKRVVCIDTGEIFNGVREAATCKEISPSGIVRACKGKQQKTAGYKWAYLEK
jgi:GIY-YIG catalytic domain./NUMOD3 motif.